jgi:hypothetical protein
MTKLEELFFSAIKEGLGGIKVLPNSEYTFTEFGLQKVSSAECAELAFDIASKYARWSAYPFTEYVEDVKTELDRFNYFMKYHYKNENI